MCVVVSEGLPALIALFCVSGVAPVPAATTQEGCRETDAKEVRARHHVSTVKETALPL